MITFKTVSITAQDVSKETKEFLLGNRADYMACGSCEGGLFFTKDTIDGLYLELVEDDVSSVFEEIANLLTKLHEEKAEMLFLN